MKNFSPVVSPADTEVPGQLTTHTQQGQPRQWLFVAAVMFCIGWGGNQFTPLLSVYRHRLGYTQVDVDIFLGAYVIGLIPGLLLASALSDHRGRKPILLFGGLASVAGSAVLSLGSSGESLAVFFGRLLSGTAVGVAMAVGTTWVSELSSPLHDASASVGAGPRRASIALTLGLGIGPGVAGVLAQWAPLPLELPYFLQIALVIPATIVLAIKGQETRFEFGTMRLLQRLRVPSIAHRRFLWVILPMAPWIFGAAGIAYAIVPQVVSAHVGHWSLLYATMLTVATLGTGTAVQPIARRLDSTSTARAVFVSMVLMTLGIAAAALTALTASPWLAIPVALLLGAAYGIAIVSGLLEIQRIAEPNELAGLTGVYYALAYIGFLLPAALAGLASFASYAVMLGVVALIALSCTAIIASGTTRHLPSTMNEPQEVSR